MDQRKKVLIALGGIAVVALIVWFVRADRTARTETQTILLTDDGRDATLVDYTPQQLTVGKESGRSVLSGRICDAWNKRPIAVMYTGDAGARKYFTGLSSAEIVVEMPHRATHGGTRVMGIFQCDAPEIVGPMRSGRVDFLGVANAFDAIFVPWGGSSIVKNLLSQKVNDHIDCNDEVPPGGGDACFRRSRVPGGPVSAMDRASANVKKLIARAHELGYREQTQFSALQFQTDIPRSQRPEYGHLKIYFEKPFRVEYYYDPETNSYKRFFNKQPDKDLATQMQYAPKNVVVLSAKKSPFSTTETYAAKGLRNPWDGIDDTHRKNDSGQYPNMELGDPWFDVQRSGTARYYMNGREIIGTWTRERRIGAPFEFLDENGKPIHFVEGQIWIEVPESNRKIRYRSTKSEE